MTKGNGLKHTITKARYSASSIATTGFVLAALVMLIGATPVHAATYLFSFTANDLLNNLPNNSGFSGVNAGVFAVFLQPVGVDMSNYVANSATLPTDPSDTNIHWVTGPSSGTFSTAGLRSEGAFANSGLWIEFAKSPTPAGAAVALISTHTGFVNNTFSDNGSAGGPAVDPASFGATDLTINQLVSSTGTFSFDLIIPGSSQSVLQAFSIYVGSVDYNSDPDSYKEQHSFASMVLTGTSPSAAPEPGTFWFIAAGLVLVPAVRTRLKTRSRANGRA